MFNIFGKKKEKEPPKTTVRDLDHSASKLVERTQDVKLKLEKIEIELKHTLEIYRTARTQAEKLKAKKKAVDTLKKKKMYQAQLQNLEQTSNNVENVSIQTEIVRDNVDIVIY
jgi:charged multivesicular body protein 5